LHHLTVSADDVFKKLMNLDTSKAAGIDNLHPTIIKLCAGPLLSTITSLYPTCLMYHTMPMQWKVHKICPVYKSGDRSN
uniref:Reverse transcriptase domain-containing protein n=1 Tax=Amphimedon queenslandica TaxID=400682 RepID=A0A1X7U2V3_AMPQE